MRKISGLFGTLTLIVAVTSCGGSTAPGGGGGGGGGGGTCPAGTFCMGSAIFFTAAETLQPVTLTVAINTPVTWTNDSGVQHDVRFATPTAALAVGSGSAGNIPAHTVGSNQRQFATAGSYPFYCVFHGTANTGMRGIVVVQ